MLCNCVIFADGIHKVISDPAVRADRTILLEHGKPMIFGANRNKGIVLDGLTLKVVTLGQDGITEKDLLVHDAHTVDPTLHFKLAMMGGEDMPVAMGVIRDVAAPTYDEAVNAQIEEVKGKKPQRTLRDLLLSGETWEVK
jgi:2-oxoglutarate ferredoxin oxidoreductase subunit beta